MIDLKDVSKSYSKGQPAIDHMNLHVEKGEFVFIVGNSGSGMLVNLIVGIIGSMLGGWIFSLFGWVAVGTFGSLITSVVGAIVLLWIVSLVSRRKKVR